MTRHILYLVATPGGEIWDGCPRSIGNKEVITKYSIKLNADFLNQKDITGNITFKIDDDGIPIILVDAPNYRVKILNSEEK